jgi:hypothetical protein
MAASSNPADPRRMAQRAACAALFAPYPGSRGPSSLLSETLEGVDRKLLYPAIRSALENEDGAARGSLGRVYGKLSDRDLAVLMPATIKAIRDLAPSNEMFGDGIRLAGLDLVSRLGIREGMALCIDVIELDRWGSGKRKPKCLECLDRYGTHARELLPKLRRMRRELVKTERGGQQSNNVKFIDSVIARIEAAKVSPTLVSMKEFMAATAGLR